VFAGDADLTGATGVLQAAGPSMGRGLGDFLVGGLAEVLAVLLDAPPTFATQHGEDGSVCKFTHIQ
jgi:hypothetical protein